MELLDPNSKVYLMFPDPGVDDLCQPPLSPEEAAHGRACRRFGPWQLDLETGALYHPAADYEVDLDRCRTAAGALDWIAQITGKVWGDNATVAGLVRSLDALMGLQRRLVHGTEPLPVGWWEALRDEYAVNASRPPMPDKECLSWDEMVNARRELPPLAPPLDEAR